MTDDTVTAKLAEWEALVEGATKGPWVVNGPDEDWAAISSGPDSVIHAYTTHDPDCEGCTCGGDEAGHVAISVEDAEFIAAAPDLARSLLGFVREVTEGHEPDDEGRYCWACASNAYGNALVPWPCPTAQAARKWLGGA
jgi:hypothetical protein